MGTQTKIAQAVYPAVRYANAKAAIAWLTSVLGFREHEVCTGVGDRIDHAELAIAGNLIMLGTTKDGAAPNARTPDGATVTMYIAFDTPADVDARYARAKAAGAHILREITDTDYGSHEFSVSDPEGHVWSFGTYRPQAAAAT